MWLACAPRRLNRCAVQTCHTVMFFSLSTSTGMQHHTTALELVLAPCGPAKCVGKLAGTTLPRLARSRSFRALPVVALQHPTTCRPTLCPRVAGHRSAGDAACALTDALLLQCCCLACLAPAGMWAQALLCRLCYASRVARCFSKGVMNSFCTLSSALQHSAGAPPVATSPTPGNRLQ